MKKLFLNQINNKNKENKDQDREIVKDRKKVIKSIRLKYRKQM